MSSTISTKCDTIASDAWNCMHSFASLTSSISGASPDIHDDMPVSAITDQFGRFRIWAGNIGALQKGLSSLDHRLREASHVSKPIIRLLQDLRNTLQESETITSGSRSQRIATRSALAEAFDSNDSCSTDSDLDSSLDSDSDSESDSSSRSQGSSSAVRELQQLLSAIDEVITSLFRLSMVTRKAKPRDRYLRSASYASYNNLYDIGHVWHKFTVWNKSRPTKEMEYLIQRFGKANTKRRQYFGYREAHRNRLSGVGEPQEDHQKTHLHENEGVPAVITRSEMGGRLQGHLARSLQPSTLMQTTASTYVKPEPKDMEKTSETGQTETSCVTSVGEQEQRAIVVPPLPETAQSGKEFECQYCFTIQSMRNPRAWRRHVLSDLEPYICTFEDCSSQLFSSRQTWFEHELAAHRREWVCNVCSSTCESEASFIAHVSRRHPGSFTEVQLPALVQKCQKPHAKIPASACPFYTEWEALLRQKYSTTESLDPLSVLVVEAREFSKHVAFHMEELALFALPARYDDTGSIEGRSDRVPSNQADLQDSSVSSGIHYTSLRFALPEAANLTTDQDRDGDCFHNETPTLYESRSTADKLRDTSRRRNAVQNPTISGNEDSQQLREPSANSIPSLLAAEQIEQSEDLSLFMHRARLDVIPETDLSTTLHLAAALGNIETVDLLLANGANIESRDKDGMTPLLTALSKGQYGVAQVLVVHGADVDATDEIDGHTALYFAAKQGHLQTVNLLLEARASLEATSRGSTPLHHAIWSGNLVLVDEMLLRGADLYAIGPVETTVLHSAVYSGHDSILELFLAKATPELIEAQNTLGETALYLAVKLKHLSAIAILMDAGSTIDTVNGKGEPPLHRTISLGDFGAIVLRGPGRKSRMENLWRAVPTRKEGSLVEVFCYILGRGANIEAKDNYGRTLVHLAVIVRRLDILQLLLQTGANVEAKDKDGRTPIHCAGRHQNGSESEIIGELVKNGAKVNERDNDGYTPLHVAVMGRCTEAVECLLRAGTDPTLRSYKGESLEDVLKNTLQAGADPSLLLLQVDADPGLLGMQEALARYQASSVPRVPEENASVAGEEAGESSER